MLARAWWSREYANQARTRPHAAGLAIERLSFALSLVGRKSGAVERA
jgi:hypothetical protein